MSNGSVELLAFWSSISASGEVGVGSRDMESQRIGFSIDYIPFQWEEPVDI